MNPVLRNILVTIGGIIFGMAVNMGTIILGMKLFPGPEGMTMDAVSMAEHMPQFTTMNYIVPILAHALGTLVAAIFIARFVTTKERLFVLIPGFLFLFGGISMAMQLPAPLWMEATDLILAYIPMAFLGYIIGTRGK